MTYLRQSINKDLSDNGVLNYFNQVLYGSPVNGVEFSPDINGYTFIFLLPPLLSGYKIGSEDISQITKSVCFLATDFTPPAVQVTASEVMTKTGSIPYGIDVVSSGQMSISFMDSSELKIFGLHKSWISYIEDVTRGIISPEDSFLTNGEIDYASSAYVIRFKPTKGLSWGDIIYVGKAIGIFPLNLPDKEVIGRRDTHELTMLSINYSCSLYRQQVYGSPIEPSGWIYDEVKKYCLDLYSA